MSEMESMLRAHREKMKKIADSDISVTKSLAMLQVGALAIFSTEHLAKRGMKVITENAENIKDLMEAISGGSDDAGSDTIGDPEEL